MNTRKKYRLFYRLEEHLETPMFILAIWWFILFLIEIFQGLSQLQENILFTIWIAFIVEFLLKLFLAPRKKQYLASNWITIIALVIPALRVFRLLAAVRILSGVRFINTTTIIRALTSGKRFFSSLKEAQGPAPDPEMHCAFLIAKTRNGNIEELKDFITRFTPYVKTEMERTTGIPWHFQIAETIELSNDNPRKPSDFLDSGTLTMAEGPYDLVCVVTDVLLLSRENKIEDGLSSSVTRLMVISARNFFKNEKENLQKNAALLILHMIGHILGLKGSTSFPSRIMNPQIPTESLKSLPQFSEKETKFLKKIAKQAPDRELKNGNFMESFIFHFLMTIRHPKTFFTPLLRNWAILLPLSLPNLATAAVAPSIILIFTAEIWDVGLGMTNATAGFFAIVSIMFASFYLVRVQNLFLPRKEKRILTEHLAVANSVIYCSIFLACVGLFFMVAILMMIIEIYVFPEDLISTWPTLNKPFVGLEDKIRLSVFVSTVGVTTGALAGGLENRTLIQHLALFRNKT